MAQSYQSSSNQTSSPAVSSAPAQSSGGVGNEGLLSRLGLGSLESGIENIVAGISDWLHGGDQDEGKSSGSTKSSGATDSDNVGQDTTVPTEKAATALAYPGVGADAGAKYDYYVALVGVMGHGGALETEPGNYNLIGIRGMTPERLAALTVSNTPGAYDDNMVLLGLDAEGNKVAKEYPGSTDPGKFKGLDDGFGAKGDGKQFGGLSENWQVKEGVYEYQDNGQRAAALGGGSSFVMTPDQIYNQGGVDLNVDTDQDDNFQGEGDVSRSEENSNFLIHRGGTDPSKDIGTWSAGCQVIAGQDEKGQLNMDEAATALRSNTDKKFNYILLDGKQITTALAPKTT